MLPALRSERSRSLILPLMGALAFGTAGLASPQLAAPWTASELAGAPATGNHIGLSTVLDGGSVEMTQSVPDGFNVPISAAVRRRTPNGDVAWSYSYDLLGPGGGLQDSAGNFAALEDGSSWFTVAPIQSGAQQSGRVIHLTSDGQVAWTSAIPSATPGAKIEMRDLRASSDGRTVVLTAENDLATPGGIVDVASVVSLDPSGTQSWRLDVNARYTAVALTASGDTLFAYQVDNQPATLTRLDPNGNVLWSEIVTSGVGQLSTLRTTPAGQSTLVFAAFFNRPTVAALSPSGLLLWSRTIDLGNNSRIQSTWHTDAGELVVASGLGTYATTGRVLTLRRLDSAGATRWQADTADDNLLLGVSLFVDSADRTWLAYARSSASSVEDTLPHLRIYSPLGQLLLDESLTSIVPVNGAVRSWSEDALGNVLAGFYTDPFGQASDSPAVTAKLMLGTAASSTFCTPTTPNSVGSLGRLAALGEQALASNNITLFVDQIPAQSTTLFLTSQFQQVLANPAGSQGTICLANPIGRFVGPGEVRTSTATGTTSLQLDLTAIPTPLGGVGAMTGEQWHFQAWYRDSNPALTSNFTGAVSVVLQ